MNPINLAIEKKVFIAAAESLTAGAVMTTLTELPGASKAFLGGVVAYQNDVKINLLGVDPDVLDAQTAVSASVAEQMAMAVQNDFALSCDLEISQVIGIATTGVAGPDSVAHHSPGTVFLAVSSELGVRHLMLELEGSRDQIREASTAAALALLLEEIQRF